VAGVTGTDGRPARRAADPADPPAPDEVFIVLTNMPDAASAERVAQALVAERLAACVNILAPCRSVYRWQDRIERADEVPLLIKTAKDRYPALQRRLAALHPYEVPEVLACASADGLPAYLDWVLAQTRPAGEG
jgi:periplasmic divalent cation tolerance protein